MHVSYLTRGGKRIRGLACSEAGACGASHAAQQCSIHAEVNMLKRVRNVKAERWTVVSLRITADGGLHQALPCTHCARELCRAGYRRVVYSKDNNLHKINMTELLRQCTYSSGSRRLIK